MRRAKMQKSVSFTFPNVKDFDVVEQDRIIQKLMPNVDHRGRHVFKDATIRVPTEHSSTSCDMLTDDTDCLLQLKLTVRSQWTILFHLCENLMAQTAVFFGDLKKKDQVAKVIIGIL